MNKNIKEKYQENGWVVIKDFFNTKNIKNIKKQILSNVNINNKFLYYEYIKKKQKLRRVEKVSDFSKASKKLIFSKKVFNLLNYLNKQKYGLFKDKLNFKYPGSKGYLPHIDGHFFWLDKNKKYQNGWKKYSNDFVNLVVPLENSNKNNGCIYVANKNDSLSIGKNFKILTNKMVINTPNIKKKYLKKFKFYPIELKVGDICVFNWKCAHHSKDNKSKNSRMIFYLTYYMKKTTVNNIRKKYYFDKYTSLNSSDNKSLLFKK